MFASATNEIKQHFQYRRHTIGRGDSCNGLSLRASSPFGESREVTREKQAKGNALPLTCAFSRGSLRSRYMESLLNYNWTIWGCKLRREKPLQKPWTINVAQRWIKQENCKDWSNKVKNAEVYNISTGQYQSSSGSIRINHEYTEYILLWNNKWKLHGMTW